MKVLVVTPHPDDYSYMGGAIALHTAKGDDVFVLSMSNGELTGDSEARKNEAKKAGEILGIKDIHFAGLADGEITDDFTTITIIEDLIKDLDIDRVYAPSPHDRHQDHRATALSALSAARMVPEVFLYETPSTLGEFNPQAFIDIEEVLQTKLKAIEAHHSQVKKAHSRPDAIEGLARFRGYQARLKYAEAFEIARYIMR